MIMTDTIADMLTRIRNANAMKNVEVSMPSSTVKVEIAKILKSEGYINDFNIFDDNGKKNLSIILKYHGAQKERVISGLKRISKPGLRVYAESDKLPKVLNGLGIAIVSTSSGIMTDKLARQKGIGGEILALVW